MKYRHYKGNIYEVIGMATHTETSELLVVYKDEKGNTWCRPQEMFKGYVSVYDDIDKRYNLVKRFTKL